MSFLTSYERWYPPYEPSGGEGASPGNSPVSAPMFLAPSLAGDLGAGSLTLLGGFSPDTL